jgi:predicted ATPase
MGDAPGSARSMTEAIDWAEHIDHLDSRLHALDYALGLTRYREDHAGAASLAEQMAELAARHGLPGATAKAMLFRGWARAMGGDLAGIAEFEEGFAQQRRIGTEENRSIHGGMRAQILERLGRNDEALAVLDATIAAATRSGQVFWLAELHRQRALLRSAAGRREQEIAADLHRALEIAAEQQATALAARAWADLERLDLPRETARQ